MASRDYEMLEAALRSEAPPERNLAPATKKLRKIVGDAWLEYDYWNPVTEDQINVFRYLQFRGYDMAESKTYLSKCTHAEIITFLTWLQDTRNISRKSSLTTMWHYFRIHIRQECGQELPALISQRVNHFVAHELGPQLKVPKIKPVCTMEDFHNLLAFTWTFASFTHGRLRIQCALLIQILAYTASRPGSVVDGDFKVGAIKYKDCRLTCIKVEDHDEWRLDITCRKTKGNGPPKTFILSQQVPRIYCPVVLFLALAFLDNAFTALSSPTQLSQIKIPPSRTSLEFRFKESVFEQGVFRKVLRGSVTDENYTATAFRQQLENLSLAAGFAVPVKPYALRRGAANMIEGKLPTLTTRAAANLPGITTTEQRNQIMGHHHSSVFRHYISQRIKVDTQAAFLGAEPRRESAEMSLGIDRRFPKVLSPDELQDIMGTPRVQEAIAEVEAYQQGMIERYGATRHAPKGMRLNLNRLHAKKRGRVKIAMSLALRKKRDTFFQSISDVEIMSQLTGEEAVGIDSPNDQLTVPENIPELFDKGSLHELVVALFDLGSARETQ